MLYSECYFIIIHYIIIIDIMFNIIIVNDIEIKYIIMFVNYYYSYYCNEYYNLYNYYSYYY